MIIDQKPLSMAEALQYIKKDESEETDVIGFIKKFTKTKKERAEALQKNLKELELMKMREEHIVKIIDLMPEDAGELNKIFVGVSLDDDEAQKILNTIKETK
jgi:DNA-directed RNA polymerase subunit F